MYYTKVFVWPALITAGLLLISEGHHFMHPEETHHKEAVMPNHSPLPLPHTHEEPQPTRPVAESIAQAEATASASPSVGPMFDDDFIYKIIDTD